MTLPFSHDARMPGKQDAFAGVKPTPPVRCKNSSALPVDAHAAPLVKAVQYVIDIAKVGYAIVRAVMVDMVNDVRLFAVDKKPSQPMSVVDGAQSANCNVAMRSDATRGFANPRLVVVSNPSEHPGFRVVRENIAQRIWYKFCSHIVLPHGLVRGSVVGATDAPILTPNSSQIEIGAP